MAIGKILVVDDSPTQRSVYKETLEEAGYQVVEAKNGKEGIVKARAEHPDVILSDISMPEMDGLEMIRNIKNDEKTRYAPVICASATFQDLETKMKALIEAGAEEFFYMPENLGELLMKVRVMCRIRKTYLELLEKNKQLQIFNKAAVDRELRMVELKEKVRGLEEEIKRYKR